MFYSERFNLFSVLNKDVLKLHSSAITSYKLMDGSVDGGMDGWLDGRTDGRTDGRSNI